MKNKILLLLALLFMVVNVFAASLTQLKVVADDGTFLGTFEGEYYANSVYNRYGNYGSPFSPNSIMNKNGNYGSDFSSKSPFNEHSSNGPWIVDNYGNSYGRLSINRYAVGVTDESYKLALQLKALRDSM